MHDAIDAFIADLAAAPTAPDAFNEYAGDDPNNAIRRANLRRYLTAHADLQPATLLVMEAPGYRGCRLTGVPVTSRTIMLEGVAGLDWFGEGYTDTTDSGFENVRGEQSATIVWNALAGLGVIPLIWNTFPFHPHKPDQPRSNRPPRQPEVAQGVTFLTRLIDLYAPGQIIAVGNVAHKALTGAEIPAAKVRHPAQGGKNDFVAGLTSLLTP